MAERTVADLSRSQPMPPAPRPPRGLRAVEGVPGVVAAGLGLGWVVALTVIFGLEPQPPSDASPSLVGFVVSVVLLYAVVGTALGLGMRQRWGAMASLAGGVAILAGATMCMLDGHSGLWLTSQFAGGAGLAALSWGALKAT